MLIQRREILEAAAGLGLSFLMPAMSSRAAERRGPARPSSLLVLWMAGGPSQLETWDPHLSADSPTTAIETSIPGLHIASLYPQVADQIHELSVIRSLTSKEGDHERGTYFVKTGYRPDPLTTHPALSAIVAHKLPTPKLEIPQHVSLGNSQWPARGGFLGPAIDAFHVHDPGRYINNMQAMVRDERQQRRLQGLDIVSTAFSRGRRLQSEQTRHQQTVQNALTMMNSAQLKAFELDDESQALRDRYGDSQFGRGCLVARRLLETGVRAVEVTLNGWDSHADNYEGHQTQAAILDPALATLITDLREHELLDATIVLCIGEFGRTPKINPLDGRDHWPKWFSCLVGGGGLSRGKVLGETDPIGEKPAAEPVKVEDLYATILDTLAINPDEEFITKIGRPISFTFESKTIEALRS